MLRKKTVLLQICMLMFLGTLTLPAQNFRPFRSLRTIKTEHFDIIFPRESELTAHTLAGFADEVYQELNTLLGINLYKRIPVVITPDTDQFNGYMYSLPYPHIVLFDTPPDLEWTTFENALRGLFLHELAHVFSFNSMSPGFEIMNRIFGGWVIPAALNASMFMVEGVTVSFESLGGFGRVNDPLIKQKIRQALHEEKTLTPFQLSGAYDLPPDQGAYYEYGGLFSAYLQEKYGMEKYAELWQLMGQEFPFSFIVYNSGLYRLFEKTYGIQFMRAWEDFLNTLTLENIRENPQSIPFTSKRSFINVLAASENEIYFEDQLNLELLRYHPETEIIEKVMSMDFQVYDMAVSLSGETLLLSSYRYKGQLASAVVTEYNASNGRKTGREWESLYRGQYFREGVIGIGSDLHNNTIVYRPFSGSEEILLRGNENVIYAAPYAINESWVLYARAVKGVRELCMFNYETKKEYVLESGLEDDALRWKYIRNLRVSNGHIMFVYNHDDRMYKLGVIDISRFNGEDSVMDAVFHSADFSGGVFLPVHIDGDIYYRGAFFAEDKLMRFPETMNTLSGTKTEIRLIPNDENIPIISPAEDAHNITAEIIDKPYFGLGYMNPLKLWLPMQPLIRTTESFISFDGLGIMSVMMDPTETNTIILSAIGDWKAKMANVVIDWNNNYFGFPLALSFADGVDVMYGSNSYRRTQASLSGSFARSVGSERNYISAMAGINFSIHANNPFNNSSAYTWTYGEPEFSGTLGVSWSNLYRYVWQLFGTGANITLYYRTPFDFSQTRLDGTISIALEKVFPLYFQFYGAWDTMGMNIHGSSRNYASYFSNMASIEYPSPNGLNVQWLGGAQVEFTLFKFEIQKNLSHIYFNRWYGVLSYRGVVYDGKGLPAAEGNLLSQDILLAQSLILRLGLDSTIPIGAVSSLALSPNIWGAWKISNMNDGKTNDFYFNIGLGLNL